MILYSLIFDATLSASQFSSSVDCTLFFRLPLNDGDMVLQQQQQPHHHHHRGPPCRSGIRQILLYGFRLVIILVGIFYAAAPFLFHAWLLSQQEELPQSSLFLPRQQQQQRNFFSLQSMKDTVDTNNDNQWWKGSFGTTTCCDHPHIGARHANGTMGMIVDPSPQRLHPVEVNTRRRICQASPGALEGIGGHAILTQKLRPGIVKSQQHLLAARDQQPSTKRQPRKSKILCMIYTVYTPQQPHANLRAIASTWGRQCDGFWAASNHTDHSIGAIDLPPCRPGNLR